jgi:hypothetical protein
VRGVLPFGEFLTKSERLISTSLGDPKLLNEFVKFSAVNSQFFCREFPAAFDARLQEKPRDVNFLFAAQVAVSPLPRFERFARNANHDRARAFFKKIKLRAISGGESSRFLEAEISRHAVRTRSHERLERRLVSHRGLSESQHGE